MILVPRAVRVYFATQPTNLRKSFDGLSNEIRTVLGHDPLGGHVFVFLNRRKNQVKLIVWTRGGFTIVHKRLERGTFTFPARSPRMRRASRSTSTSSRFKGAVRTPDRSPSRTRWCEVETTNRYRTCCEILP